MSLLNDALRDLENREGAGEGSQASIPAGLNAAGDRTPVYRRWILGGAALLLAVLAGAGFWRFGASSGPHEQGAVPVLQPEPAPVIRTVDPEPEARVAETTSEASENATSGGTQGSETIQRTAPPAPADNGDEGETQAAAREGREQSVEPPSPEAAGAVAQPEPKADSPTVRELTPAERDRRLARELEELLADGRVAQARQRLRQRAMLDSDAPRSRAVMARHALAREASEAALQWLPADAVALYPELRLLRARVALAREDRASALEWLEAKPPGAAAMPAYHTMMAALYQQTGNHEAAAGQWAALIETDDRNARWWAGLGIAMEARGREERARAAYSQALSLPDLAPQLRRYIEQRLAAEKG